MTNLPDDRSAMARATEWASNVSAVAFQMAVPLLIGVWIDRRLETKVAFTLAGGALGLAAGIWSLLRMTKSLRNERRDRHKPPP